MARFGRARIMVRFFGSFWDSPDGEHSSVMEQGVIRQGFACLGVMDLGH